MPDRVEAVVVGGGVIGLSTAYWLARYGTEVLLLEARRIGWAASGRNAGLLLSSSSPLESLDRIRDILHTEGIDAHLRQPGHLALAASDEVLEMMLEEVRRRPVGLAPLAVLDRAGCEELLKLRISPQFRGGRWLRTGAAIHPLRFANGLADAVCRHGGAVAEGVSVRRVRRVRGRELVNVTTTAGTIVARHAVVAAGLLTMSIVGGTRRLLTPSRAQMLATMPMSTLFQPGMAMDWGSVFWRQIADGTIIIGGCRDADPRPEATGRDGLNPRIQRALEVFLPRAFPDVAPVRVARRWSGVMDATPDNRPIAGSWEGGRVWLAAGFGGHGLPPALGIGEALAASVRAGHVRASLEAFDPARFGVAQRPVPAAHDDARARKVS